METLAQRVRAAREERGWSQMRLASEVTRAGYKIGQSGIGNIESGKTKNPLCIVELAAALRFSASWLRSGRGARYEGSAPADDTSREVEQNSSDELEDMQTNVKSPAQDMAIPRRAEMPRDVPVLGTAVGGKDSDFAMNGEIIDYVRRPPGIIARGDVFCLNVVGESMVPWRRPKSLVYLEASRAPSVGDYVVIELKPRNGSDERPALLKELVGMTPTKLKLRQYKPAKDFAVDRRRIAKIYRVIDIDELLKV